MSAAQIEAVQADITTLAVEAIVNAANEALLGGGGVDGAIHRAAGRELLAACRALPQVEAGVHCPTGEARITPGFNLPAKFVIHTVGPVWDGGTFHEDRLLANCYRNSLLLAALNHLRTVAFPAISTGIYGYPLDRATRIAVREVRTFLTSNPDMHVTFCCFDAKALQTYREALKAE